MSSYYTLQVLHSDVTVPEKSKVPNLYIKISYGDQTLRTSSVNELPPRWNETFPITCSDTATQLTIKLKKEENFSKEIGHVTCTVKELLRENGEDVHITLQPQDKPKPLIALCLRPSDRMKNAEITLMNLAHTLLGVHPSNDSSLAEKVNTIFDAAKRVAESKACQSLVEVGYSITAFVEFGNSIAEASPYLKFLWCITTAFIKIIAEQPGTDKRVKDLVKNLMGLFLINKETSVFANPSESLLSIRVELFEFITQCSTLLQDYVRRSFLVRAVLQVNKTALEDLETRLANLKADLISAFERQGTIEVEIRALREELEKKLQPKHVGGLERRGCLDGTRTKILEEIKNWMQDTSTPNVFFLLGQAGTGKSTIATTIAESCQDIESQLGSHQYFVRGKSDPAFIFRTIAYDLAKQDRAVAEAIKIQLTLDNVDLESITPDKTFDVLLYKPLYTVMNSVKEREGEKTSILIVLDALDECGDREARKPYIKLIKEKVQTLPPRYRFLITSRPEEDIVTPKELEGLKSFAMTPKEEKKLKGCYRWLDHELEEAKYDVLVYMKSELAKLRDDGRIVVEPNWPWEQSMKILGEAANGLFIWATTAVRLIESKKGNMGGELKRIVKNKSLSLGGLYATALESSLSWDEDMENNFSKVFSLIMFSKEQLSDTEINDLLGLDHGSTKGILSSLRSLVAFEPSQPVRLYHTSLYDYLISEGARGKAWFIDEKKEKSRISLRCFELMEGLRFNICGLKTSYKLNKDVENLEDRVRESISTSLLYACCHWASHLWEAPYSEGLCNRLESFAFNRLLYWVEVLSLTGSLYAFLLQSIENAITWIGDRFSRISEFLQDAHDQLLTFIGSISQSSPHLYMSFLPLTREDSIVAEHYAKRARSLTRVEYVGNKPKMACTRQINAGSWVYSISYSPDGEHIASGSDAGVTVWDAVSGRPVLGPLRGHSGIVMSVAYSVDGNYIASGSDDCTIRVWSAATGESILSPLVGHSDEVNSVAFSRDRKYIASGSDDQTIRLWDVESGALVGEPLRGHSGCVECVVFSPNERYLASGSSDGTIVVWDVQSREMISDSFKGHSEPVYSLSFSPDSERVASGSKDGTIRVWEVSTGSVLHTFSEDDLSWVRSVAYSGDGKHILSGSIVNMVRLWDAEDSNAPPRRFKGHTSLVMSVSFSADSKHFSSGSFDNTIRVWDVDGGVVDSEFKGNSHDIRAIAISPQTGKFLVCGSYDYTVYVYNTESGELIKGPLKGHSSWVMSVAFSSNENHFASGAHDKLIRIWNMIDDTSVTCNGHADSVRSVAFSPDGIHLASGSHDKSVRVWIAESGSLRSEPFLGHTDSVYSVRYSPDGRKLVSGSVDKTVRIWDALNGNILSTFNGHSDWVNSVAYSNDGLYVVSGSSDNTIRVWNMETRQVEYNPVTDAHGVDSVCFSTDGRWIISGSWDKTVCVWDASNGGLFFQSRVASPVNSIATFPTTGKEYIKFASSSYDGTICVWSIHTESERKIWCLEDDGWLTEGDGKLLIWVPPDLRHSLVLGPCIRTLNTGFQTILHLSIDQGDQWTACFSLLNAHIT